MKAWLTLVLALPLSQISAQALVVPATVSESPFKFERKGFTLYGTLTRPRDTTAAPLPVVLIVAGSGPTDRNANGPLIHTNAYAMLAWRLAEQGIASVRYDKRAIGQSAWPIVDATQLSLDDYVADAIAGTDAIVATHRFSRVILLGHSEGAGIVLLAANRGAQANGVIMVSGQGRKLADVLHDQFARQTDSASLVRIDTGFAQFLRGETPRDVPPIGQVVMLPGARKFLQSLAAYDPIAEVARLRLPLLILQGRTDLQVLVKDAELLHAAQPRATLTLLPDVNHVLKTMSSTLMAEQQPSYHDPSLPLAPSIIPAIVTWIQANVR